MSQTEKNAVESAVKGFYDALGFLFAGDGQSMQRVWSHQDDVVYMGPDGLYLIGWAAISDMWKNVAEMKLGGAVLPRNLHTIIGSDISVVTCVESGANEVQGQSKMVEIRSSTVFRKENNVWMVIAHQTDLLAFM
ncbi:MAG: nuclear transport factor 2 family protein [Methylotenera sp.]